MGRVFYSIRQGFKAFFRHFYMSISAVLVLASMLCVMGVITVTGYNADINIERLGNAREVNVYIAKTAGEKELDKIEERLVATDGVESVRFFSREERMSKVSKEVYGKDNIYEGDKNPLRDAFVVTVKDAEATDKVSKRVGKIQGVEETVSASETIKMIDALSNLLYKIVLWIFIILLIISLIVIFNTISVGVKARRDEIRVMRLIGATDGFIITPFIVESVLIAVLGAGLASGLTIAGYSVLKQNLVTIAFEKVIVFAELSQIANLIILPFFAGALLISVLVTVPCVRKNMK